MLYGQVKRSGLSVRVDSGFRAMKEMRWSMLCLFKQKTAYEIVVLPLTISVVRYVKRHEQVDTYDNDVNYSIWRVFSI